ncbi:MAG: HAD-IB family hydrolase [Zoogloeaceae bacterium]|jgi:HAD superfamily hydrolase (TIGR01490 family)|nr:HAD-IB family hydrolase [Zoogloeaceae bacterium]
MHLALFDLDHTLLSGDSDFEWGRFLIDKGLLDRAGQEARNRRFYEEYKAGTLDIAEFLSFQLAPLAAHPRPLLESLRREYLETRIRPLMRFSLQERLAAHQRAGDLCALVTATNSFVTGPIARIFGIEHLIATIPACEDGFFTGKPRGVPAFREGKILRVEAWLESLGLWWSSFAASWFYSDSHNDLPLLEKVCHPVVVAPDAILADIARSRGWEFFPAS